MSLTSAPLSLKGAVGSRFLFEARWEILGVTDRCHLEVTRDGKKWDKLARYEGGCEWAQHAIDLKEYDGASIQIRFHVLSGGQRQGRGFEMASPRIESVPVTRRLQVLFPELSAGWQHRKSDDGGEILYGAQSESSLSSANLTLPAMESPTMTLEGRLLASSVYAKASVEGPTGSEWKSLRLPLDPAGGEVVVCLSARFNQRKDEDGLYVRKLTVQGGEPGKRRIVALDGGGEDGDLERQGLLRLVAAGDLLGLRELAALRGGLPSLRSALALLPLVKAPEHVSVLLDLFSQLKEEAIPSFALLTELAAGEDLALQTRVLLRSGVKDYASTRDYLGAGLVSGEEFAQNCELYLAMRRKWTEQTARSGLALLMTPIAAEGLVERAALFARLLAEHESAEDLFSAWERAWEQGE
jgi:hypothetical protein